MTAIRVLAAFVAAVLVTSVLGAVFQTQFVLAALTAIDGVQVDMGQRLAMTAYDAVGLLGTYAPIIAGGFLVGFLVAAAVLRWLLPGRQVLGYSLAGAVALATILIAMDIAFGFSPIAGARSLAGAFFQVLAGAAGGWVFARWHAPAGGKQLSATPA